ncbi:regulator of chromosome condensation-like isoform X2 [Acipenser ruthenus]|uniref:regulator of chromosome condensation-like isoform X2 n=1 Tax=Acipenser ruthenus TaxID=7906 RepID=UPI002740A013|nr:regulator of chromosome condensation-like isoform X2 [Acipenser ruthenus]
MEGKRGISSLAVKGTQGKPLKVSHPSHGTVPGLVLVLGQGDVGQLGLGEDVMERKRASLVTLPEKTVQVEAGGMHTVCLSQSGKVYTFGCNDEGALGRDTSEESSEMVPGKVELEKRIVQVSAGDSHTAALSENGVVYIWGSFRDNNGVIGLLEAWAKCTAPKQLHTAEPILSIKSGNDHLVLLTLGGNLYTLGCGEQGQLGRVPERFSNRGGRGGLGRLLVPQPVRIKSGRKVKFQDIFCGAYFTFGITKDDRVFCFGLSNYHQLGQVYSLGRAEYGRLGLGEGREEKSEPTAVPELTDAETVACGASVSFAVTRNGRVFAWGMGTNLQLGTGEEEDEWRPVEMTGKQLENRTVLSVSSGGQHTVLLVKDR